MKHTFKLTLLSIALSSYTVQSCEQIPEERPEKKAPKMVANTMRDLSEENKTAELDALDQGMAEFSAGNFYNALDCFREALGDYGSPLGYFYASFLEIDRETKVRYLRIAHNAESYGALPEGTLHSHNAWVKETFAAQGRKTTRKH